MFSAFHVESCWQLVLIFADSEEKESEPEPKKERKGYVQHQGPVVQKPVKFNSGLALNLG